MDLKTIACQIEMFEASQSVANTGTGTRREGEAFEILVGQFWKSFVDTCNLSTQPTWYYSKNKTWACLQYKERILLIPCPIPSNHNKEILPERLTEYASLTYKVSDLVRIYPGEQTAIKTFAPKHGKFSGDNYPNIYQKRTTEFDSCILCLENNVLVHKVLLEYKTGKSSKQHAIDGNAHERLSFQIMQYLEIATQYPSCKLLVMANGAFIRYHNKYHTNFHIQSKRLRAFGWFDMTYATSQDEYLKAADGLKSWLKGKELRL